MGRKKKIEISAISDIINKQQFDNADLLKSALKRANNL